MVKCKCFVVIVLLVMMTPAFSQQVITPTFTIFLIGDAGKLSVSSMPYKDTLQFQIKNCQTASALVFLGDNIYPTGMPAENAPNRAEAESILKAQVDLALPDKANHQIYFVPGNHDWNKGKSQGYEHIMEAQQWLAALALHNVNMLPHNGCPGPVEISLSDSVMLVILDTQWFLHKHKKAIQPTCSASTLSQVIHQLDSVLTKNKDKHLIVAAHHPIYSYGNHGGVFSLRQHVFPFTDLNKFLYIPLPLIGSMYPLYRKYVGNVQDLADSRNNAMREALVKVLEKYPGIIYASGHEHALQHISKDSVHYVGSGTGVNSTYVTQKGYSKFASSQNGFVKITWFNNGGRLIEYFSAVSQKKAHLVFKLKL
jgi:hypothetical protein